MGWISKGMRFPLPNCSIRIGEYGDESKKDFWVYFTSPHPRDMGDDVIEIIRKYNCLAKQIHLPLQSGDDKVLIKMNRNHNLKDYKKTIKSIQNIFHRLHYLLILSRLYGETEEQFNRTVDAMETIRFNMAYIARYSPRPGAASSRWDDDISHAVKEERLHILSTQLQQHSQELNNNMIGDTYKVLVIRVTEKEAFYRD